MPTEDRPSAAPDPLAALRPPTPTLAERARQVIARVPSDARPWAIALVAVLTSIALAGAFVVYRSANGRDGASRASSDDALLQLPFAGTTLVSPTTAAPPPLVAHAVGAVVNPGVFQLPPGSRVGDLVVAAGGASADADVDRLNLAAPLADGMRLYVPRRGEADLPTVVDGDGALGSDAGGSTSGAPEPIDLNRATLDQLEGLPGIGPSIGQAIIDHRGRSGPFQSVDDLLDVRGIGPARLEQLRPLVKV